MKTTGNTILITGATSGIGRGLALRLHNAGNTVIVAGRREELLKSIVADNPGIHSVVLDVDEPDSIAQAFRTVTAAHPELNVLVNMAGIMRPENLLDPTFLTTAESTITTNLLGPLRMLAAFTPFLVSRGAAEDAGATIINVSSGLAFVPLPLTPTYNATKAAIHSFTQSLRVQLAGTGVQVLELVPPAVQTDLMGQANDESAMPLEDYLSEVMGLLAADPSAEEILVDKVKGLRFAEANGAHADILAMLSAHR
jgi:uncharacterized oxidoreductase